jgi:hypothetical protein
MVEGGSLLLREGLKVKAMTGTGTGTGTGKD